VLHAGDGVVDLISDCSPQAGLAATRPDRSFPRPRRNEGAIQLELHEIRYSLALSRNLNFSRAAEECNVSQPALTRAVRKMEHELGGLLFSRERNNTHLTQLGRLIEPHLSEIMAHAGAAKQSAQRFIRLERATLALGVMCTIAPVQFITFLGRFRADNPSVEVTLLDDVPDRLCDLLLKGEVDLALMARPSGFPAPLRADQLYSERYVVACSAGHRFAGKNNVHMAELDGEFYFSRINCEFQDVLGGMCRAQGVNLVKSYRSEREDWILTMVAAGLGVCFLPEFTAAFPGVIGCPVVSPFVERNVSLVSVAGRRRSPPVEAFAHAVRH
jgi:LysR family transcriptional regulator, hydrogen peroxide-inducible genes activator